MKLSASSSFGHSRNPWLLTSVQTDANSGRNFLWSPGIKQEKNMWNMLLLGAGGINSFNLWLQAYSIFGVEMSVVCEMMVIADGSFFTFFNCFFLCLIFFYSRVNS